MRWERVCLETVAYHLPEERVSSDVLEARLEPLYTRWRMSPGQLVAMTGVKERRWWPAEPRLADCAVLAARKALQD